MAAWAKKEEEIQGVEMITPEIMAAWAKEEEIQGVEMVTPEIMAAWAEKEKEIKEEEKKVEPEPSIIKENKVEPLLRKTRLSLLLQRKRRFNQLPNPHTIPLLACHVKRRSLTQEINIARNT